MKLNTAIALALPVLSIGSSLRTLLSTHPKLSTLHNLLTQFELLNTFDDLSNITVIAPTNQAYLDLANWGFNVSQIPAPVARALFQYHILVGEHDSYTIGTKAGAAHTYLKPPVLTNVTNGAVVKLRKLNGGITTESGLGVFGGVEESDLEFDGGILHTLNASMVLPHNITLTAQVNGLTSFLDLMDKAGVVEEFEALKDVTVFVPTNAALEKLDIGAMSKDQMAHVLKGHVVPSEVLYSDAFRGKGTYKTLGADEVNLERVGGGALSVNGVEVVKEDVILYAGVAHVISEVLGANEDRHAKGKSYLRLDAQIPLAL